MMVTLLELERNIFSLNLIKYRKMRNLSQEELSELTGLSRRTIAHYETKAINPPIDNIEKLAKALNVNISNLVGENTDEKANLFEDIDIKTLKKILLITKLPSHDRNTIYNMIDMLILKNKQKDNIRKHKKNRELNKCSSGGVMKTLKY